MSDSSTYKVVEIVGSSPVSIADAMQNAVGRASKTLRHIDWVELGGVRGHVEGDKIVHFQAEVKIGFKLEE